MPEIIWSGRVFYDGQYREGRVVRTPEKGDLACEIDSGHDAMLQTVWRRSEDGVFREFLVHCGNILLAARQEASSC
jgi:hypothetical protein